MSTIFAKPSVVYKTPFGNYMPDKFGGTEYMARNFIEKILPFMPKFNDYLCVVIPGLFNSLEIIHNEKQSIIWLHNLIEEFPMTNLKDVFSANIYLNKIKYVIAVSEYHKKMLLQNSKLKEDQIIVIPNAIDRIYPDPNKFNNKDKIKIIHASEPSRGMEILLKAMELIDDDKVELKIFNAFNADDPTLNKNFIKYFDDSRIWFYGKTPRRSVLKEMSNAHIHAYPSTHTETFCLTQVEALAAGCFAAYSNSGALEEVSLGYGKSFNILGIEENHNLAAKKYAKVLQDTIAEIRNNNIDTSLQSKVINETYSWDAIKLKWQELHDRL